MNTKAFWKSTALKSLAILTVITMLCGGLLALCNDLLYVTEEERFFRSLAKIYGNNASVQEELLLTEENSVYPKGSVKNGYLMNDGNYLVKSTGNGAYQNGTVTVWTVVTVQKGSLAGIEKVLFDSTTVSNYFSVSDVFMKVFAAHDEDVSAGKLFSVTGGEGIFNPSAGATASGNAINNAVNTAILFVKKVGLGENEQLLPFEAFINLSESTISANTQQASVSYSLLLKANPPAPAFRVFITVQNGVIKNYSHEGDFATGEWFADKVDPTIRDYSLFIGMDSAKFAIIMDTNGTINLDGVNIMTGATYSSKSFLYAAGFALSNYSHYLEGTA